MGHNIKSFVRRNAALIEDPEVEGGDDPSTKKPNLISEQDQSELDSTKTSYLRILNNAAKEFKQLQVPLSSKRREIFRIGETVNDSLDAMKKGFGNSHSPEVRQIVQTEKGTIDPKHDEESKSGPSRFDVWEKACHQITGTWSTLLDSLDTQIDIAIKMLGKLRSPQFRMPAKFEAVFTHQTEEAIANHRRDKLTEVRNIFLNTRYPLTEDQKNTLRDAMQRSAHIASQKSLLDTLFRKNATSSGAKGLAQAIKDNKGFEEVTRKVIVDMFIDYKKHQILTTGKIPPEAIDRALNRLAEACKHHGFTVDDATLHEYLIFMIQHGGGLTNNMTRLVVQSIDDHKNAAAEVMRSLRLITSELKAFAEDTTDVPGPKQSTKTSLDLSGKTGAPTHGAGGTTTVDDSGAPPIPPKEARQGLELDDVTITAVTTLIKALDLFRKHVESILDLVGAAYNKNSNTLGPLTHLGKKWVEQSTGDEHNNRWVTREGDGEAVLAIFDEKTGLLLKVFKVLGEFFESTNQALDGIVIDLHDVTGVKSGTSLESAATAKTLGGGGDEETENENTTRGTEPEFEDVKPAPVDENLLGTLHLPDISKASLSELAALVAQVRDAIEAKRATLASKEGVKPIIVSLVADCGKQAAELTASALVLSIFEHLLSDIQGLKTSESLTAAAKTAIAKEKETAKAKEALVEIQRQARVIADALQSELLNEFPAMRKVWGPYPQFLEQAVQRVHDLIKDKDQQLQKMVKGIRRLHNRILIDRSRFTEQASPVAIELTDLLTTLVAATSLYQGVTDPEVMLSFYKLIQKVTPQLKEKFAFLHSLFKTGELYKGDGGGGGGEGEQAAHNPNITKVEPKTDTDTDVTAPKTGSVHIRPFVLGAIPVVDSGDEQDETETPVVPPPVDPKVNKPKISKPKPKAPEEKNFKRAPGAIYNIVQDLYTQMIGLIDCKPDEAAEKFKAINTALHELQLQKPFGALAINDPDEKIREDALSKFRKRHKLDDKTNDSLSTESLHKMLTEVEANLVEAYAAKKIEVDKSIFAQNVDVVEQLIKSKPDATPEQIANLYIGGIEHRVQQLRVLINNAIRKLVNTDSKANAALIEQLKSAYNKSPESSSVLYNFVEKNIHNNNNGILSEFMDHVKQLTAEPLRPEQQTSALFDGRYVIGFTEQRLNRLISLLNDRS